MLLIHRATIFSVTATFIVGLGISACGGPSKQAALHAESPTPSTSTTASLAKPDRDNDGDNNDDDAKVLAYGRAAGATERQIAVALVKRYFRAAAAEDGALACQLLAPLPAETIAETYGHSPGLHGKTCATVMSKLFRLHHHALAQKSASIMITTIRRKGNRMLVVLGFPPTPELRQIAVQHIGGMWRVLQLLDGIIE
jgi:hypothetical protein